MRDQSRGATMTFEEQAAELHALDALAMSLGLSDAEFVQIATTAIGEAHAEGTGPNGPLVKIRQRLVEHGKNRARAMVDLMTMDQR